MFDSSVEPAILPMGVMARIRPRTEIRTMRKVATSKTCSALGEALRSVVPHSVQSAERISDRPRRKISEGKSMVFFLASANSASRRYDTSSRILVSAFIHLLNAGARPMAQSRNMTQME